jgi:hypothetical protein
MRIGNEPTPQPPEHSMARAARHTVLRRVAPALKHDMVVHLQAVALMAETLSARLERGAADADDLQASLSKLNRLAREAVASCLKVTSWIDGPEDESVPLCQGVRECLELLAPGLNFRGFTLGHHLADSAFEVNRNTLRHLLVASLLAIADAAAGPCELVVDGRVDEGHASLRVHAKPREHEPHPALPAASEMGPRPVVDWAEVQALAAAEDAELVRRSGTVQMRLPRAVVTSPLQMAPV